MQFLNFLIIKLLLLIINKIDCYDPDYLFLFDDSLENDQMSSKTNNHFEIEPYYPSNYHRPKSSKEILNETKEILGLIFPNNGRQAGTKKPKISNRFNENKMLEFVVNKIIQHSNSKGKEGSEEDLNDSIEFLRTFKKLYMKFKSRELMEKESEIFSNNLIERLKTSINKFNATKTSTKPPETVITQPTTTTLITKHVSFSSSTLEASNSTQTLDNDDDD